MSPEQISIYFQPRLQMLKSQEAATSFPRLTPMRLVMKRLKSRNQARTWALWSSVSELLGLAVLLIPISKLSVQMRRTETA